MIHARNLSVKQQVVYYDDTSLVHKSHSQNLKPNESKSREMELKILLIQCFPLLSRLSSNDGTPLLHHFLNPPVRPPTTLHLPPNQPPNSRLLPRPIIRTETQGENCMPVVSFAPFIYMSSLAVWLVGSSLYIPKKSNNEPNAFRSLTASAEPLFANISCGPM